MDNAQDSTPFFYQVGLSVTQRMPIIGKPDYFILAKGSYVQQFDGRFMPRIVGDYAISFGEACRKITEILDDYPINLFQLETISFSRGIMNRMKKEKIRKLVTAHNSNMNLKISQRNLEKRTHGTGTI